MVELAHRILGLKQIKHKLKAYSDTGFQTDHAVNTQSSQRLIVSKIKQILRGDTSRLRIYNTITLGILDILLGCIFSFYLISKYPNLFSVLLNEVETFLNVILDLLQWLRGSPAGLKLNAALNSLLCRFFSYHLHLWRNYIGVIEPILSALVTVVTYTGCFGLTVQIALIKDVLSIATFHIYCLYIYATRLFNVQRKTVISLGRLFFGKKWNPLRQRVDSVHLTISEMFLGSLGFTIAIFLFPTTIIYYIVFLGLRIPVRLIEYVLRTTVDVINSTELVTSVLIWTNSPSVADDIYFKPSYTMVNGKSTVTFEIRTFSTKSGFSFPNVGASFKNTLSEIYQGVVLCD